MSFAGVKLGMRPPRPEQLKKLLRAKVFLAETLPPPPTSTNHRGTVSSFPMHLNDQCGCCVFVSVAHQQRQWGGLDGTPVAIADGDVLQAYSNATGFDPRAIDATGANPTDNGAVIIDALNLWRTQGFFGNKLIGYAAVGSQPAPIRDRQEVRQAIHVFGALHIGINLPLAYENASEWRTPTPRELRRDYNWAPNSWGGHSCVIVDYDERFLWVATWGQIIPMEWDAAELYISEAYVNFDPLWFGDDGQAPNGLKVKKLERALAIIDGRDPGPEPAAESDPDASFWERLRDNFELHYPARAGDYFSIGKKS